MWVMYTCDGLSCGRNGSIAVGVFENGEGYCDPICFDGGCLERLGAMIVQ